LFDQKDRASIFFVIKYAKFHNGRHDFWPFETLSVSQYEINMRKITTFFALAAILSFNACQKDSATSDDINEELDTNLLDVIALASDGEGASRYMMPASDNLSSIPQDPLNKLTPAKVALGRLLFHESALTIATMKPLGEGKTSCATCHFASAGFQAGRFQGIGEGGIGFGVNGEGRQRGMLYDEADLDVQPIRTPSAMNGAYQINQLWNGQFGATGLNVGTEYAWTPDTPIEVNNKGYEGLEVQAIAGLKVHRMDVDMEVLEPLGYKEKFDLVFGDFPEEERYTRETAGLAIAAYERTILSNEAPFQKWLAGDKSIMSDQEKRGAIVFFEKGKCVSCHDGPSLNKMEFHALGMDNLNVCPEETFKTTLDVRENLGRGGFTGIADDNYKFKTPQLYNLADSPFFGHGSSFRTIKSVVMYKNLAIQQNEAIPTGVLSEEFVPLNLSEEEVDDLTAFLSISLRDQNLMRYQPESVLSGDCIPVSDPMAASDLGCN